MGQLRGMKAGDQWRIAEDDVLAFLKGKKPKNAKATK
jgi:hypothetical protein